MKTFDDIDAAVKELKKKKVESVILTKNAAVEFLKEHCSPSGKGLEAQPFDLMREISDDDEPNADGSLNFTNVQDDDIETTFEGYPTDAEIQEYVDGWECWQLWKR